MKKLFILSFVICFTMCTPKPQTGDTIFVDLDQPEKASLFDYFRSIELIPLETSSDVLVKGITKIIVHQDYYYALDKPLCLIFVFDKTGKFLFKIGTKGQGAGEYSFIEDFNINPFSGDIEILEPYGRIHIYDLSGNFIETKRIDYPGFRVAHSLAALDSITYVSQSVFEPKKILYFNLDEQKLLHEEFEESRSIGAFSFNPYQYQNDWFFFRPFHPVVYKMGKERLEVAVQSITNQPKLVIGLNQNMCRPCVEGVFTDIKEIFPDFESNPNIICIADIERRFKDDYYGKKVISFNQKDDFPLYEIDVMPYFFILDKDLCVKQLFITDKTSPELTKEYLKTIKEHYTEI